jgi:hypothetical protein
MGVSFERVSTRFFATRFFQMPARGRGGNPSALHVELDGDLVPRLENDEHVLWMFNGAPCAMPPRHVTSHG